MKQGSQSSRRLPGLPRLAPWLVFLVSLPLFWYHAAPSVTYHDSGEFAMAAASMGMPHPPGAPTWTLLAGGFVRLLGFTDIARGTNFFSGLCAAVTAGLLCFLVQRWSRAVRSPDRPAWPPVLGGVTCTLVLLHSSAFFEQATMTEQYTLMTAFLAGILIVATAMVLERGGGARRRALPFALGLLWGLAIGNHLSQTSLGLLIAWAVWSSLDVPRRPAALLRRAAETVAGLALGLSVYAWVVWRSRANPLLDFGNIKTFERLLWALGRRQWSFRPVSEAPPGFVWEWLVSYEPAAQLGLAGLVLAAVGLVVLARRRPLLLGWLAAAVVPYSAGILLGHMKQEKMDVAYIRNYGVGDFHLVLYVGLAVSAGLGVAILGDAVRRRAGRARLAMLLLAAWLVVTAGLNVRRASLRSWNAPEDFLRTVLAPLTRPAVVIVGSDNLSHMLAYRTYVYPGETNLWVAYGLLPAVQTMASLVARDEAWSVEHKVRYLTETVTAPEVQPLRVDWLTPEQAVTTPLYTEYLPGRAQGAPWMLPAGYLFQAMDRPVTVEEARAAEARWRAEFPHARPRRQASSHPWECEAWALVHQWRGAYFQDRGMWAEAEESYAASLDWVPDNGPIWYCLGAMQERQEKWGQAAQAYQYALDSSPFLKGPRMDIGILHARAGRTAEAERWFLDELRVHPDNQDAAANLKILRERMKGTTTPEPQAD
ncbi:MAG: DUF2723 domain-containing protein [Kiritimatiellae bacterium]|nr:DUF2723 domain-containing protein [Kiritimatiellia bacterium]